MKATTGITGIRRPASRDICSRDAGGVPAGQRHVRAVGARRPGPPRRRSGPASGRGHHGHLEDAAGADREEVRVLRVVVDDPPLRTEELDAVDHALGRGDTAATQAGLATAC